MSTQADISPGLTDDNKAFLFQYLDAQLNSEILYASLHGIYTGIFAITLWNICGYISAMTTKPGAYVKRTVINKRWPIRRGLVVLIILLHALTTVNFAATWSSTSSAFIGSGQNFFTVFFSFLAQDGIVLWEMSITASISTILADLYMIWCCWMVWGRRWPVILLPIISLIAATASKVMAAYTQSHVDASSSTFLTLYTSLILVTTLWCTLFIVHRILTVAGVGGGAEGRLRFYHRFIEVLVESSALYSISLILYLAFTIQDSFVLNYLDGVAAIARGIAPTLLIGRVTTGHRARPGDSWQGSVMASVSIMSQSQHRSRTSFREDDRTSPVLDGDLEAQREVSVREPSPTVRTVSVVADYAHPNTDVSPDLSPHLGNRSLLHDRLSPYADATLGSTVVDKATFLSR